MDISKVFSHSLVNIEENIIISSFLVNNTFEIIANGTVLFCNECKEYKILNKRTGAYVLIDTEDVESLRIAQKLERTIHRIGENPKEIKSFKHVVIEIKNKHNYKEDIKSKFNVLIERHDH